MFKGPPPGDHYRLTSEGWKIASRVVTMPFDENAK
jgi:hypothetical protein